MSHHARGAIIVERYTNGNIMIQNRHANTEHLMVERADIMDLWILVTNVMHQLRAGK